MDNDPKCWLCGRSVEDPGGASITPHSGIPIHRECLEDDWRYVGSPLAEPGDVVYFAESLFKT
jgi:hypothetical protein